MHELGITTNIVEIVVEAAKGKRVTRVVLEVGDLAGVMADSVAFCFDVVANGTPVEGAKLDIVKVPGVARCGDCGAEFGVANLYTPCACGSYRLSLLRGQELLIKTMEIEEAA